MIYRSREARRGVTLTEVLVAIFIMGIGLLSLLVLFPLGALQMAQAIRDDRCTHANLSARALANMQIPFTNNLSYTLKDDPNTVAPNYSPSATAGGPSVPVYIDPIGVKIAGPNTSGTIIVMPSFPVYAYQPSSAPLGNTIPRVCPSFINLLGSTPFYDIDHWCTMTDDIQFDVNGSPLLPVQRQNRYTWAWFCRQTGSYHSSSLTTPTPLAVETTVVVYDRRPLTLGANKLPAGETVCTGTFTLGSNSAALSWTGTAPNLKAGTWVLDATNYYFYRIVSSTISSTSATIELHMNARGPTVTNGTAVVMESVAEVYEKGPIVPQ